MKIIKTPRSLQDLYGRETSLYSLIATNLTGLIVALVLASFLKTIQEDLPLWKLIAVFVLTFDIAGGVVSNYSDATRQFYQENKKKHTIFIFLHILHGVLFILIFRNLWVLFSFMSIYAVASCFFLTKIRSKENKRITSALLFIAGTIIVFLIPSSIDFLKVIPVLFFTKLILAFSGE